MGCPLGGDGAVVAHGALAAHQVGQVAEVLLDEVGQRFKLPQPPL